MRQSSGKDGFVRGRRQGMSWRARNALSVAQDPDYFRSPGLTAPDIHSMIHALLPSAIKRIIVFPTAIDTRWGPDRLRTTCENALGVELERTTAVLFHNRAMDRLVLYAVDADGDRCLTKKLDRGVFLLPVPAPGQRYVVLSPSKLGTLFRS